KAAVIVHCLFFDCCRRTQSMRPAHLLEYAADGDARRCNGDGRVATLAIPMGHRGTLVVSGYRDLDVALFVGLTEAVYTWEHPANRFVRNTTVIPSAFPGLVAGTDAVVANALCHWSPGALSPIRLRKRT